MLRVLQRLIRSLHCELGVCKPCLRVVKRRLTRLEIELPSRELLRKLSIRLGERAQLGLKRLEPRIRRAVLLAQMTFPIACNLESRLRLGSRNLARCFPFARRILPRFGFDESVSCFYERHLELAGARFLFRNRLHDASNVFIERHLACSKPLEKC